VGRKAVSSENKRYYQEFAVSQGGDFIKKTFMTVPIFPEELRLIAPNS